MNGGRSNYNLKDSTSNEGAMGGVQGIKDKRKVFFNFWCRVFVCFSMDF